MKVHCDVLYDLGRSREQRRYFTVNLAIIYKSNAVLYNDITFLLFYQTKHISNFFMSHLNPTGQYPHRCCSEAAPGKSPTSNQSNLLINQ